MRLLRCLPALLCLALLALTGANWVAQRNALEHAAQQQLNEQANALGARLQQQLEDSEHQLRSLQAFFATDSRLPAADTISGLLAAQTRGTPWPGLLSLSYAPLLLPEQLGEFLTQQRASKAEFEIRPGGARALYAPYLLSAGSGPAPAAGLDALADPDTDAFLFATRDAGTPQIHVQPLSEHNDAPGFVIAVPLFSAGPVPASVEERRRQIRGWAIARFDLQTWLQGAAAGMTSASIELHRTDAPNGESFFLSGPAQPAAASLSALAQAPLSLGTQSWTLRASAPRVEPAALLHTHLLAAAGALLALASLLLGQYLLRRLQRARAEIDATQIALAESDERWHFALEGAGEGVWDWNLERGSVAFSPRCDLILGTPEHGAASARIHPEDEAPERAAMQACLTGRSPLYQNEHRMLGEDGQWRWIAARGMVVARDAGGNALRMIGTLSDVSERHNAGERLAGMAREDELTGLPNRALFFNLLQQAMALAKRRKQPLAMIHIDLDNFKSINDNFGQAMGNALLREIARALRAALREADTVAYCGSDEFALLLPTLAAEADALQVAEKLRQAIDQEFVIQSRHLSITASLGVAIFPTHARSAEALFNAALRATLQAKQAGRNAASQVRT